MIAAIACTLDEVQEAAVELAVVQGGFDGDGAAGIRRDLKGVMDHRGRAGWDLVVVEGDGDVLDVAPLDAVALPVQDIGIEEPAPGVNGPLPIQAPGTAYGALAVPKGQVQPEFVGVRGPLGQGMPHAGGAHHQFQEVAASRLQARPRRAQGGMQGTIHGPVLLEGEEVQPRRLGQDLGTFVIAVGAVEHPGYRRVGGGEEMVVDAALAPRCAPGRRVLGCQERHVAVTATGLGLWRVVEAVHPVARDPAQKKAVVVILAAQPSVVIQGLGQMHLVAGGAETRGPVQGPEQALLVQFGLGPDRLTVQGLEQGVLSALEGVRGRVGQAIGAVALGPADVGDGVTGHAGNAGLGPRVRIRVIARIVEAPGVEWDRIVAGGAQAGGLDSAVPGQQDPPGLLDARPIGRVVEGAHGMDAGGVALGNVRVALGAGAVGG